jgi:hypothetical protein
MVLPDTETLELSDTLDTILAGIEYHQPPALFRLGRAMFALTGTPGSVEQLGEAQLRKQLEGIALDLFKSDPRTLKAVDQALAEIELEIIRKRPS